MTVHRKKIIEHSLPLEAINAASSREKSVRHGHPSTLHLWWARRPLAACRAVLFAQLVDDPGQWPDHFPTEEDQARERRRLHDVIANMVEWPKSSDADQKRFKRAIEAARAEIARSIAREKEQDGPDLTKPKAVLNYLQAEGPPVYDPFCGGGSIPLEAQRLGLRAYGSDLNPVAVLITKALIEFPPKFADLAPVHPDAKDEVRNWEGAQGLAEDVRRYGQWMRDEAEQRIGHLYPKATREDGSEATVIAWLWARTVVSPDPVLKGAHVPLASSFVLSSRKGKEAIVMPVRDPEAQDGWRFTVKTEGITAEELAMAKSGTKTSRGSNFICVLSGTAVEPAHVKREAKEGRMTARLMAVVAEGDRSRVYLAPTATHEEAAEIEKPDAPEIAQDMPKNPRWFSPPDYGMPQYKDLFTPRQLTALTTFSDLVAEARERVLANAEVSPALTTRNNDTPLAEGGTGPTAYADAVATYLAFGLSKATNRNSTLAIWEPKVSRLAGGFGRQAIPMQWSYAETNPLAGAGGDFFGTIDSLAKPLEAQGQVTFAKVVSCDAPKNNYPIRPTIISTDPPYYDNIGYADLSDFFYVWLRRTVRDYHPDLFRRLMTPKEPELVATPYRHGGSDGAEKFFMDGMREAIAAMRAASTDQPLTIYYAFKQAESRSDGILSPGWAAFLQAVVSSGVQVDGTWPLRLESTVALKKDMNALASSVVLVCRKRADDAPVISRRDFQRELRLAMEAALRDQQETIPLPDRRQAAIGPGIGVFSKYSAVREVDDSEMSVAAALALINAEIDRVLADGTEALDAETRFALELYAQHGFSPSPAGQAISALQGFNLTEGAMNRSGMFLAKGGTAKLLSREEIDPDWRPSADDHFTAWEMAQHLARILGAEDGGIDAAGRLLAQNRDAGPDVLLIAERLYDMENTRGKAAEALVWNELQQAWPQLLSAADRATEDGVTSAPAQTSMDV